ncbi:hypothetical protein HPB52_004749 [Rhipicephalus sanguineus]|uniref:Uncharacterized protein n=1 Tax=Rhipicephalus sanguineus TaxID=34632 RepID=A0A9D4T3U6_RHISA|nr:hypothetical protein HPB52_004749 [Rhipicephalus sanguineus]
MWPDPPGRELPTATASVCQLRWPTLRRHPGVPPVAGAAQGCLHNGVLFHHPLEARSCSGGTGGDPGSAHLCERSEGRVPPFTTERVPRAFNQVLSLAVHLSIGAAALAEQLADQFAARDVAQPLLHHHLLPSLALPLSIIPDGCPCRRRLLEGLHKGAVRAILGLPKCSPVAATLAEAGEWPLTLRMLQRALGHIDRLHRAADGRALM